MELKELINYYYENKYYSIEPTELCLLMDKYGSDKGTKNKGKGNYTKFYELIFNKIKDNNLKIFEVGLGTNNLDVPSTMGLDGVPGASLRGWKDYFSNSEIFGGDIDRRILFEEQRIKTYFVDQFDRNSIINLWSNFDFQFDVILDDGLHDISHSDHSANRIFFENSISKLKKSGFYIIEDVACDYNGDHVSPKALKFIEDVKNGIYGEISFIELIKTPAFREDGGFRNTQIILINK